MVNFHLGINQVDLNLKNGYTKINRMDYSNYFTNINNFRYKMDILEKIKLMELIIDLKKYNSKSTKELKKVYSSINKNNKYGSGFIMYKQEVIKLILEILR